MHLPPPLEAEKLLFAIYAPERTRKHLLIYAKHTLMVCLAEMSLCPYLKNLTYCRNSLRGKSAVFMKLATLV